MFSIKSYKNYSPFTLFDVNNNEFTKIMINVIPKKEHSLFGIAPFLAQLLSSFLQNFSVLFSLSKELKARHNTGQRPTYLPYVGQSSERAEQISQKMCRSFRASP